MPKKKGPKIHELKVILVGKTGAGKTNLINVLIGAKFQQSSLSTTVSNFVEKKMTIENKKYNLEIWDTAGQEKFHSLSKLFIKESRVVLLVYDITDKSSFEDINFWFELVKEVLGNKFVLGLAGNKKDLFLKEMVSESEGQKKAEEIGATFKLTSAKTGEGINELIDILLKEYIKRLNEGEFADLNDSHQLSASKTKKKKKKCCN